MSWLINITSVITAIGAGLVFVKLMSGGSPLWLLGLIPWLIMVGFGTAEIIQEIAQGG